jgi:hypothetical protein
MATKSHSVRHNLSTMAIFRRKRKPRSPANPEIASLHATLQRCLDRIAALEHERGIDIARMAAMQSEIDHLRSLIGRPSSS